MKTRLGFVSNSSSSSFIIRNNMGLEEVTSTLKAIIYKYNRLIKKKLLDDYHGKITLASAFIGPRMGSKKDEEILDDYGVSELEGKIIIHSTDDNSIPSWIIDEIENTFNCVRIYSG